jgi:hypothetical protein
MIDVLGGYGDLAQQERTEQFGGKVFHVLAFTTSHETINQPDGHHRSNL